MKKLYQTPDFRQQDLIFDTSLLSDDVEAGSFQDPWGDVDSRFTDEF